MTTLVKTFIEDNIETINKADWYKLFSEWYHGYAPNDSTVDSEYLKELFRALQTAGIDCKEESREARLKILEEEIQIYVIYQRVHNQPFATVVGARNHISSWLGAYTLNRRVQIIKDVFTNLGLEPENKLELRYKLS